MIVLLRYFTVPKSDPNLLHKWPKGQYNLQATVNIIQYTNLTSLETDFLDLLKAISKKSQSVNSH